MAGIVKSSKFSDEEIEKLCQEVVKQLRNTTNHKEYDSLAILRRICGKTECGCTNIAPHKTLSHLLKVLSNSDTVTEITVGLSIIDNYNSLAHENHCQRALEQILKYTLRAPPSENGVKFLDRLWTCPGLRDFKIDLVADFLNCDSKYIEKDIFSIFEEALKNSVLPEGVWKQRKFERIVFWSCNSPRIFCAVTSVLNMWLHRIVGEVNQCAASVSVVNQFIISVKLRCAENNTDFVSLYPSEYHSLVTLLDIKPDFYPENGGNTSVSHSTIVKFVEQNLKSKPVRTLCLLTHFPEWAPHIHL